MFYDKDGKVQKRGGKEMERASNNPPPCRTRRGCPKGTPETPNTLLRSNEMALEHYLECKAVNSFPDDGIVRNNAMLISGVYDSLDRKERLDDTLLLSQLIRQEMSYARRR